MSAIMSAMIEWKFGRCTASDDAIVQQEVLAQAGSLDALLAPWKARLSTISAEYPDVSVLHGLRAVLAQRCR